MLKKYCFSEHPVYSPFVGDLFTAVLTLDILIFLQTSGNHLSYPSIIMAMKFNIDCISDPFLQGY